MVSGTVAGSTPTVVLADVMPGALLSMTGQALGGWYRSGLVRFRQGPATLKLDWALDGPIPWMAPEPRGAGTVHIGGDEAATIESLAQSHSGLAERPFLLLGQQSVADPSRAPEGKHTAWAYTHAPVSRSFRSQLRAATWRRSSSRWSASRRASAIGSSRVTCSARLSSSSAMPNLVGGDVGGGSYGGLQSVFRPLPTVSPYKTPLDGLFLCSAAAFPGGAVHGVPGDAAARAALRSRRRP